MHSTILLASVLSQPSSPNPISTALFWKLIGPCWIHWTLLGQFISPHPLEDKSPYRRWLPSNNRQVSWKLIELVSSQPSPSLLTWHQASHWAQLWSLFNKLRKILVCRTA